MKYYAVANGRSNGIYQSWDTCKAQVLGFPGAKYKKFDTLSAAQDFVKGGTSANSSGSGARSSTNTNGNRGSIYKSGHGAGSSMSKSTSYARKHDEQYKGIGKAVALSLTSSTQPKNTTQVYVDGACRGNGKAGGMHRSGYGVYFGENDARNKAVPLSRIESAKLYKPTNQRAELHAANDALKTIEKEVTSTHRPNHKYEILTDSKYTKLCLNEWSDKWLRNGWKSSNGGSVLNRDIIEDARKRLDVINGTLLSRGESPVVFTYVPGHQGVEGNEQADRLANLGADQYDHYC